MNARCIIAPLLPPDELQRCTPAADRDAAAAFTPRRRAEYLSWRAVIYKELGPVKIGYDPSGGPVIEDSALHIGVSHAAGQVAVAISENRCAVDIESSDRDFSRAAARYMTPQEMMLDGGPLTPGIVWCTKEALYKYARTPGLDLLEDLTVDRIELPAGNTSGSVVAHIRNGEPKRLRLELRDGLIVVCLL